MIDFHTHLFAADVMRDRSRLLEVEPWFGQLYADPRRLLLTPAEMIAVMDETDVTISVTLGFPFRDPGRLSAGNDEMASVCAASAGRLIGFGMVDPTVPAAPAEVARCAAMGLRGIGELNSDAQGFDPADSRLEPFLEAVRSHNLILMVHASEPLGHQYAGRGSATPERLFPLLQRCGGITVVLAHLGGGLPFYASMPKLAGLLENVHYDLAAAPFLYSAASLHAAGEAAGFDHLLFGSDLPLLGVERYRDLIREGIPPAHRAAVTGESARCLLDRAGIFGT